jgi:hypothetical protein
VNNPTGQYHWCIECQCYGSLKVKVKPFRSLEAATKWLTKATVSTKRRPEGFYTLFKENGPCPSSTRMRTITASRTPEEDVPEDRCRQARTGGGGRTSTLAGGRLSLAALRERTGRSP